MSNNAELFLKAAGRPKEVFLDDAKEDASQKERLADIWNVAHMSMRELVGAAGLSQTAFAKKAGIPPRTVQDWCGERRECPVYVKFLLAEHYGLIC